MQSQAKDVSTYLQEVPEDRQAVLAALRQLCLELLPNHQESMQYGMPCYQKDSVVEVTFASQKNYIALYILKQEVMNAHKNRLVGISLGKGCIRYSKPAKIDFTVVRDLLVDTAQSENEICGPRNRGE